MGGVGVSVKASSKCRMIHSRSNRGKRLFFLSNGESLRILNKEQNIELLSYPHHYMCLQGDHDIDCNAQLRILAPGVLEVHCYCLCYWSCDPQLSIFQPPAELLSANFVEHRQPK